MKPELYQDFFEYYAFPVFAFSSCGKILYKNPAANKYLPMLRKNADAVKHFYPSKLPCESCVLHIVGDTPYHIALALQDGEDFLALCFSRFQYGDGTVIAGNLLRRFGNTAIDFLGAFHGQALIRTSRLRTERIYTDLFELMEGKDGLSDVQKCPFYETVSLLFEKLNTSFGALGYRIRAHIEEDFLPHKELHCRLHDFLFLFGRLLYLQMRLSENGDVSVFLTSNTKEHIFRFCIKTDKLKPPLEADVCDILSRVVPECAPEFLILQKAGMLHPDRFTLSFGLFGDFTAEYRVPYFESTPLSVKSMVFSPLFLTEDIQRFIITLEKRLKDNGAFY